MHHMDMWLTFGVAERLYQSSMCYLRGPYALNKACKRLQEILEDETLETDALEHRLSTFEE